MDWKLDELRYRSNDDDHHQQSGEEQSWCNPKPYYYFRIVLINFQESGEEQNWYNPNLYYHFRIFVLINFHDFFNCNVIHMMY